MELITFLRYFRKPLRKSPTSGSQGPGEWLDFGKEPQASPAPHTALSSQSSSDTSPLAPGVSMHPLAGPTSAESRWWDPSLAGTPPTGRRVPKAHWNANSSSGKRVPVWGENKDCIYSAGPSALVPRGLGPWEPPSSPLNLLLGSHPQTEGQGNIPGMRGEEILPSSPQWGPGTVSRPPSPPRTTSQLLVPLLPTERSLPVVPAFKGRLLPDFHQLIWGEALELRHQRQEQFCGLGIRGGQRERPGNPATRGQGCRVISAIPLPLRRTAKKVGNALAPST